MYDQQQVDEQQNIRAVKRSALALTLTYHVIYTFVSSLPTCSFPVRMLLLLDAMLPCFSTLFGISIPTFTLVSQVLQTRSHEPHTFYSARLSPTFYETWNTRAHMQNGFQQIRKFFDYTVRVKLRRFSWSRITHKTERSRFVQKPSRLLVPLLR